MYLWINSHFLYLEYYLWVQSLDLREDTLELKKQFRDADQAVQHGFSTADDLVVWDSAEMVICGNVTEIYRTVKSMSKVDRDQIFTVLSVDIRRR